MILIIDKDKAAGSSLERVLRYSSYDAMSLQDGMEALNLLNIRRPKLIILDLQLDGSIPGQLVLESIRMDPAFDAVPIWIFTEDFSTESQTRALRAGAQQFIVKGTVGYNSIVNRIAALFPPTD